MAFGFISVSPGTVARKRRTYPAIFFRALALQSWLQLQLPNDAILYESECAVSGPLPISMADYFSVSRALLPRRGRQTERAARSAHLHVSCADKTNFEPPDEIRRTGREFVIRQRGVLSLGTYRCVSNLFRYAGNVALR